MASAGMGIKIALAKFTLQERLMSYPLNDQATCLCALQDDKTHALSGRLATCRTSPHQRQRITFASRANAARSPREPEYRSSCAGAEAGHLEGQPVSRFLQDAF